MIPKTHFIFLPFANSFAKADQPGFMQTKTCKVLLGLKLRQPSILLGRRWPTFMRRAIRGSESSVAGAGEVRNCFRQLLTARKFSVPQ